MGRRSFVILVGLALAANLLPLALAKYLPFSDLSGHMGLAAALINFADPTTQSGAYYALNVRFMPTVLYEAFCWAVSPLVPLPYSSNLFIALYCVVMPAAAMDQLLLAMRRDRRLVFFLFPLLYHLCLWFGFVGFCASIGFVLWGTALTLRLMENDERGAHRRLVLELALCSALTVAMHFFGAALLFAFAGMLLLITASQRRWRAALRIALGLLPGVVYLAVWLGSIGGRAHGGDSLFAQVFLNANMAQNNFWVFYQWTIAGLGNRVDEVVFGLECAFVVIAFAWAMRFRKRDEPKAERLAQRLWQGRAVVLFVTALALFLVLPMSFRNPGWWGVRVRVVPLLWLFAVLALPRPKRPYPGWLLWPVAATGIFYGSYLAYDFRSWYMGVEMAGLDEALDAIPRGQKVLFLWPNAEKHYDAFPMAHASQYYTVRRGGMALPALIGGGHDALVVFTHIPPIPIWGRAEAFSWDKHGTAWPYFVVKDLAPGLPPSPNPFRGIAKNKVIELAHVGLWHVYQRK